MTVAAAVAAVLVLAAAIHVGAWWWGRGRRPTWLERATRRRVMVQTTTGQTLDGHLAEADRHGLVLQPVKLEGGPPMAGQAYVPRERVAWIQQPPTEE